MSDGFIPEYAQMSELQSRALFNLDTLGPGTYTQRIQARGNSILSSIFIKSIDAGATIQVNWFDQTTGRNDNERFNLQGHALFDDTVAVPFTDRVTVTRVHDAPICEVVIAGGNVEFGIYATIVSSFASDLDAALVDDGQTYDPNLDKSLPISCYDEDLNKFFFLRCKGGAISVTTDVGTPYHLTGTPVSSTPGSEQTLLSFTVPASTQRNLRSVKLHTISTGCYSISERNSGTIIGSGAITPAATNGSYEFDPPYALTAGEILDLKFTPLSSAPVSSISSYAMATDVTV